MLEWINNTVVSAMDVCLGWALAVGHDAALVTVALATALILTVIRRFATNQDLLARCRQDRKRLKQLIRQAKRLPPDERRAELKRLKLIRNAVALKILRQEPLALLLSIIPIAVLACWAFARLPYHPVKADSPVEVWAWCPASAVGKLAHLVPCENLAAEGGWIREIEPVKTPAGPVVGRARWRVTAPADTRPYPLIVRFDEITYRHELLVGQNSYSQVVKLQPSPAGLRAIEIRLEPFRPLGAIPGWAAVSLPPWLVGYLLITIPAALALRRLLRVY